MSGNPQTTGEKFSKTIKDPWATRRHTLFAAVSLAVMILLAYSNTFHSSWHFDDEPNILERRALHLERLEPDQIYQTFFHDDRLYRPVACLSLALNYYLGGNSVTGYHVINTSVHFIAAFFLYLLIRQIGTLPAIYRKWGPHVHAIALLSAALWALNPINTQAVTYIVQRMASMAAMFYVMAMYFYLRARQTPSIRAATAWFMLCAFTGLLAVGSKENAAMLPVSLLLMEYTLIKQPEKLVTRKRLILLAAAFTAIVAVAATINGTSFFDPARLLESYEKRPFTLWERILTQPRIMVFYLTLIFYPMPHRLSICHDIHVSTGLFSPPETIAAIVGLAGLAALAVLSRKRFPLFSFAILFFFANHVVESTILPLELIFEHRNYLPSMVLFVPMIAAIYGSWHRLSNPGFMKFCISSGLTLLLIGFGSATHMRNHVWENEGTLWSDASLKAPGLMRPRVNLGKYFYTLGRYDDALANNVISLSLRPIHRLNEPCVPYHNIGLEYHRRKKFEESLDQYRKALDYDPLYASAHNNMGGVFTDLGEIRKAAQAFRRAVENSLNDSRFRNNLGYALLRLGNMKEAEKEFSESLNINTQNKDALKGLGYIYRLEGAKGKAFYFFGRAVSMPEPDPTVFLYLAEIYMERKTKNRAKILIERFAITGKEIDLLEYMKGIHPGEATMADLMKVKHSVYQRLVSALYEQEEDCNKKFKVLRSLLHE
jgi:protein O-mannosyl-transferase